MCHWDADVDGMYEYIKKYEQSRRNQFIRNTVKQSHVEEMLVELHEHLC